MRALILILAAVVVALAVSIVIYIDERPAFVSRSGPFFYLGSLLADAQKGERAVYRESTSHRSIQFTVEDAPDLPPMFVPYKRIRRERHDARGKAPGQVDDAVSYDHRLTDHGWFPLMAPEVPEALDRVWIVRSIRLTTLQINRREYECWRVDLIDPALPEGSDTVVAWLHDSVPVYGLLKWKRGGETWEFQGGSGIQ
jgi:hypothetical protein